MSNVRNFNKNKDRLKDGVHYTSICWDEIRTGKFSGHVTPKTRNLHVLTDAGMKSRPRMSGLLKNQFFKAINEIPGAVKVKRGPHYRH